MSARNNPYFDIQLKTDRTVCKTVKVTGNINTKRTLFLEKVESKTPIRLSGLSPSKSGVLLFNSNTGSRMLENVHLEFKYTRYTFHHDSILRVLRNTLSKFLS